MQIAANSRAWTQQTQAELTECVQHLVLNSLDNEEAGMVTQLRAAWGVTLEWAKGQTGTIDVSDTDDDTAADLRSLSDPREAAYIITSMVLDETSMDEHVLSVRREEEEIAAVVALVVRITLAWYVANYRRH